MKENRDTTLRGKVNLLKCTNTPFNFILLHCWLFFTKPTL